MTYHGRILLSDLFGVCFALCIFCSGHPTIGITMGGSPSQEGATQGQVYPGVHIKIAGTYGSLSTPICIYIYRKKHETPIKPLSYRQYQPIQRP